MLTQIINGRILTPQGWLKDGSVLICDGKILEVTNSDLAVIGATVIDARGMTIVPGFVSMHAHGGGGHDFTEATEEAFRIAAAGYMPEASVLLYPGGTAGRRSLFGPHCRPLPVPICIRPAGRRPVLRRGHEVQPGLPGRHHRASGTEGDRAEPLLSL